MNKPFSPLQTPITGDGKLPTPTPQTPASALSGARTAKPSSPSAKQTTPNYTPRGNPPLNSGKPSVQTAARLGTPISVEVGTLNWAFARLSKRGKLDAVDAGDHYSVRLQKSDWTFANGVFMAEE